MCVVRGRPEVAPSAAQALAAVPVAIAAGYIDVAAGIDGGSRPCHPDATLWRLGTSVGFAIRRRVPDSFLGQSAGAVGYQPAVVWRVVAMSAPGDQHVPVRESQPRALVFQDRVEGYCRAITVLRGTGHLCLNFHGAVELL